MDSEIKKELDEIRRLTLLAAKTVFSVDDLALYLGRSPKTIRNNADKYPHYKNEYGQIFFKRSEIDDWLCAVQHNPIILA